MTETDYDVAVIGSGVSGLSAAACAASAGARVLVAESESRVGGSSRLSTGIIMGAGTRFQRAQGIEDSADELFYDYLTANQWDVETGAVRRLAEECGPAVEWLADQGLEFRPQILFAGGERAPRGHSPVGDGEAIIRTLLGTVRGLPSADIAVGRRVDRLLTEDGSVVGLAAGNDTVRAGAVVIASGGFGANPDLIRQHFPGATLAGDWSWYIGAPGARGDGLVLARDAGAAIIGHDHGHCGFRANFNHDVEASYLPGWLIVVTPDGSRFFNEMAPYGAIYQLLRACGGRGFAVFDEASKRSSRPHASGRAKKVDIPSQTHEDWVEPYLDAMIAEGKVVRAGSIEELARTLGIPPSALSQTVDVYNAGVREGADHLYLKDPKVLREISEPPFYAAEMRLGMLSVTATGPRTDSSARVLRPSGAPVPGLYAAGEVIGGVVGKSYLGSGNSLANCVVFGRIAGFAAAARATGKATAA
jgi:fumarate reductase flavoprotein subunit